MHAAGNLTRFDLAICRVFALLVRTQLSNEHYSMIPRAWPEILDFQSKHTLRNKAQGLAGVEPTPFDCCINSCICFAGERFVESPAARNRRNAPPVFRRCFDQCFSLSRIPQMFLL